MEVRLAIKDNRGGQLKYSVTEVKESPITTQLKVITAFLDHGANIEARTAVGATPLHAAIYWGNKDVVRLLISRGADKRATMNRNGKARSPLQLAEEKGHAHLFELLKD